jgi:uncharacterized protein (TIGR03118 family)
MREEPIMMRSLTIALLGGALAGGCTGTDPGTGGDELSAHVPPTFDGRGAALRVRRTNLTADQAGVAAVLDPDLVNAWGLAFDPDPATGPEPWVASNGTDSARVYHADGTATGKVVSVPGAPTGLVYTEAPDFLGDEFIFATEAGTILGWQDAAGLAAVVRVDDSAGGAIYKGLAVVECDHPALAVTDFHNGKIDLYGAGYAEEGERFVDHAIPAGFAPFGIAQLDGDVYVSYARQDADGEDDVAGPGNGFVDVFEPDGRLERRLISGGHLNSPWGMVIAPPGLGALSNKLLVGNFGDGAINVYEPHSGEWRGQLRDEKGKPLVIDGLWALSFGPRTDAADLHRRLYFTAGPDDESHGVFGVLQLVQGHPY